MIIRFWEAALQPTCDKAYATQPNRSLHRAVCFLAYLEFSFTHRLVQYSHDVTLRVPVSWHIRQLEKDLNQTSRKSGRSRLKGSLYPYSGYDSLAGATVTPLCCRNIDHSRRNRGTGHTPSVEAAMVYVEERGDIEDDSNDDYGYNDLGNDSLEKRGVRD